MRIGSAFACAVLAWMPTAAGEPTEVTAPASAVRLYGGRPTVEPWRPIGMAEAGIGLLTLPAAEVCVERDSACAKGDTSLMVAGWQLFRPERAYAVGAGITLGLTPTTDAPRRDPTGLPRDHARRYMTVEAVFRYYVVTTPSIHGWAGLTSGLVVVSDSFLTQRGLDDKALVGPRGVVIRTEGFTASASLGLDYRLAPRVSLGAGLRYGQWFLPKQPERNPIGDEASLNGRNTVFDVTVSAAYRLPL